MDPSTREIYEQQGADWIRARRPVAVEDGRIERFAARLAPGARVADLGSGPGWYADALRRQGFTSVALDLSRTMLREAGVRHPGLLRVCADLAQLPFARESLAGALALNSYCHLPLRELPESLAHLHGSLVVGAPVELTLADLDRLDPTPEESTRGEGERRMDREFAGRLFAACSSARARALLEGAGFDTIEIEPDAAWLRIRARRALSLPDFVRPNLRLLICGLNPSVYAAEIGVPFGRPGNRFWPAAQTAGLVERDRDPLHALERGIGFTDLVKRATPRASELDPSEYEAGLRRIESLVRACVPRVICFVGLEGWRLAVDRRARPGWIDAGFAGARAYLMPSTSGLNARSDLATLARHLATAAS